jgi:hypothetical protein
VVPSCEYGDQISREAKCLCSGRHVADEVGAEAGILIRLKIRKMDHGARSDGRRGEVRHESYNEFLLPEEVERDDCGDAVCRELRWVDLVKQDFFLKCHASIVAWGRMVGSWCEVAYSISTDASRLKAAWFIFGVSHLVAAARRTDGGRTHRSQRQRCLVSCRGSAGAPGMSRTRPHPRHVGHYKRRQQRRRGGGSAMQEETTGSPLRTQTRYKRTPGEEPAGPRLAAGLGFDCCIKAPMRNNSATLAMSLWENCVGSSR